MVTPMTGATAVSVKDSQPLIGGRLRHRLRSGASRRPIENRYVRGKDLSLFRAGRSANEDWMKNVLAANSACIANSIAMEKDIQKKEGTGKTRKG